MPEENIYQDEKTKLLFRMQDSNKFVDGDADTIKKARFELSKKLGIPEEEVANLINETQAYAIAFNKDFKALFTMLMLEKAKDENWRVFMFSFMSNMVNSICHIISITIQEDSPLDPIQRALFIDELIRILNDIKAGKKDV